MAVMFQSQLLTSSVSSNIKEVDDIAPYAIQLAECIDQATKKIPDPKENRTMFVNQKISEIGAVCAGLMGWVK